MDSLIDDLERNKNNNEFNINVYIGFASVLLFIVLIICVSLIFFLKFPKYFFKDDDDLLLLNTKNDSLVKKKKSLKNQNNEKTEKENKLLLLSAEIIQLREENKQKKKENELWKKMFNELRDLHETEINMNDKIFKKINTCIENFEKRKNNLKFGRRNSFGVEKVRDYDKIFNIIYLFIPIIGLLAMFYYSINIVLKTVDINSRIEDILEKLNNNITVSPNEFDSLNEDQSDVDKKVYRYSRAGLGNFALLPIITFGLMIWHISDEMKANPQASSILSLPKKTLFEVALFILLFIFVTTFLILFAESVKKNKEIKSNLRIPTPDPMPTIP